MLVFSISSFRKPLSKASAYLSAVTENFACPYALETATGPTSDRTASAARVCRVRCGVGTFFQPHFIVRLQCFYGFPGRDAAPNMRCRMEGFSVFRRTQRRSLHKSPPPSVDGGRGRENIQRRPHPFVGEMADWAGRARGRRFLLWLGNCDIPIFGAELFPTGEMISILNWPEKLMHIFFEKPVTCSPYSVSLTDAWTFDRFL